MVSSERYQDPFASHAHSWVTAPPPIQSSHANHCAPPLAEPSTSPPRRGALPLLLGPPPAQRRHLGPPSPAPPLAPSRTSVQCSHLGPPSLASPRASSDAAQPPRVPFAGFTSGLSPPSGAAQPPSPSASGLLRRSAATLAPFAGSAPSMHLRAMQPPQAPFGSTVSHCWTGHGVAWVVWMQV